VLTQKAGWTVGAGIEGRLFGNVTGKIEYLYMDFGTISTSVTNPFNATPVTLSSNSRVTDNIVRVGLNYKFDPARGVYDVLAGIGAPSVYKALPPKGPVAYGTPIEASWTWAGFYVGGTIGYGWGKSNTDTVFSDPATSGQLFATNGSRKLEGAVGGAQGGYNWVAGNMLAGVEADLNYSGQRARMRAGCPGEVCNPALVGVVSDPSVLALSDQGQKLEWFATLRARLGATVTPGALAYVTGGLAVGEIMTAGTVFGFDGDGNPVNTIVSSHNTKAGWTVGGGIEGRLAGNWTAKLEYLYLDLGMVSTVPTPPANATVATAFNSRVTDNIVRAGLNYKFDTLAGIWAND
jgi:opacity protein-like surface antigen